MKIGLLGNISKIKSADILQELAALVQENGHEPVIFSHYSEIDAVDVVIVLGGDGAILHASVPAAKKGIKIIGINYGTVGFLTEYEKNERERVMDLLNALEKNDCKIVKRSLLQLEISDKKYYALNEIAIQREYGLTSTISTQVLHLKVEVDEGNNEFAGDGLLVCTPTGSTAYSLSAGGAILTPEVPVTMLTPICAFSMRARPIVFSDTEIFKIYSTKGRAIILADGKVVGILPENTEIRIQKAPFTADFPVKKDSDFFARVRNKLDK